MVTARACTSAPPLPDFRQSLNLYRHAANSPVTFGDPDGHYLQASGGVIQNCGNPCNVTAPPELIPFETFPAKLFILAAATVRRVFRPSPPVMIPGIDRMPIALGAITPPGAEAGELGEEAIEANSGQIAQAERVLEQRGPAAVRKAIRSLERLVSQHESKSSEATGYTHSRPN